MTRDLRIRVTDDKIAGGERRIEVLDRDGNVLGDLRNGVGGVTWKMGVGGDVGIVAIELLAERVTVESVAMP